MSIKDKQIPSETTGFPAQLKWAGLMVLLLLLAWAILVLLSAYNSTGQCLSKLSKLSESEMKLRVIKSYVAHSLGRYSLLYGSPRDRKIMFLGRSITQQELIQRNEFGTLLDLLKEQPLQLSDKNQLNQFHSEIDKGEFTILNYSPKTTYSLLLLPGKTLHRSDPTITSEFFKMNKHLGLTSEKFNNFGNYLYEYEMYNLDATCCGARQQSSQEEIIEAKKENLAQLNFRKRFPEHRWSFSVSNCGSVWFPPHPQDQE
jgi:hypothetical protein